MWHTIRHLIYASQFLVVANLRFHGWALLFLAALFASDVYVAWSDVWEETEADEKQRVWTDDYSNILGAVYRRLRDGEQ